MKLQRDVDELISSSRPHSSQLSIQRELDSVRERHHKQVLELEQTIDSLRQQMLRLRARELGMRVAHFIFSARQHAECACYRLSVRLSHGWISQKLLKLGLRNFHHTVAPSL